MKWRLGISVCLVLVGISLYLTMRPSVAVTPPRFLGSLPPTVKSRATIVFRTTNPSVVANAPLTYKETCDLFERDARWRRRIRSSTNACYDYVGPGPVRFVDVYNGKMSLLPPVSAGISYTIAEFRSRWTSGKGWTAIEMPLDQRDTTGIASAAPIPVRGSQTTMLQSAG